MKTIEEKAKRYDEAFEKAKKFYNDEQVRVGMTPIELEEIFPELAESEDEKIIRSLKEIVTAAFSVNNPYGKEVLVSINELKKDDLITWLEKQGEQKHKIQPKFKIGDIIRFKGNETLKGEVEAHKIVGYDNELYVFADGTTDLFCEQDLYELVEQKSADKIEPKFKVGDWIIDIQGVSVNQIIGYEDYNYHIKTPCSEFYLPMKLTEKNYRLWTIQDAKDGDVLANDHNILILKELYYDWSSNGKPSAVKAYCGIKPNGNFEIGKDNWCFCGTLHIHPATKEQRDLLFKKMKEAGYEWDAEKKELKKIEDEPNKCEGCNNAKGCVACVDGSEWAHVEESEPAWSKEDEQHIDSLLKRLDGLCRNEFERTRFAINEDEDWLKSLKERVQPQTKKEWSEEDERIGKELTDFCIKCSQGDTVVNSQNDFTRWSTWLKSIKPQNNWKPSEEQIEALEHFVRSIGESGYASPYENNTKLLYSLLEQIKKLREE